MKQEGSNKIKAPVSQTELDEVPLSGSLILNRHKIFIAVKRNVTKFRLRRSSH